MKQQDAIKIFEDKKVRTVWDEDQQTWFISNVDIVTARNKGNETVKNCHGLKNIC